MTKDIIKETRKCFCNGDKIFRRICKECVTKTERIRADLIRKHDYIYGEGFKAGVKSIKQALAKVIRENCCSKDWKLLNEKLALEDSK